MKKQPGARIPLYVPADATDLLDAVGRLAERRRWSRNKTIVEVLRRALRPETAAGRKPGGSRARPT